MPLFYQQHINQFTKLAIWKIEESEDFFSQTVPVQQEITHPHKRLQHLAGRYLLRYLFPSFPYEEILIANTRKPYLANDAFHFSISHCKDYAAAIVSTQERVGIDIEISQQKINKIAHKFTSSKEIELLKKITSNQSNSSLNDYLTLIWCCKETMFKWYGLGSIDFKTMLQLCVVDNNICSTIQLAEASIQLPIEYHFFKEFTLTFAHQ